MFTDILGPVNCNITGYGNFSATLEAGPILSTVNNSNISFNASKIQSASELNLGVFDLSNTVIGISQNTVINVQIVSRTIPVSVTTNGSIITIGSNGERNVNVQFTSQWCESLNTIIALAGTGCLQFNCQIAVAGSSTITGDNNYLGPMISNLTDAYKIFATIQTSISKSLTQAIQAANPGSTGGTGAVGPNSVISLTSLTIQCSGGLLYVTGFDQDDAITDQPHISIVSTDTTVNSDATANNIGLYVNNAYVTAQLDTYLNASTGVTGPASAYNVEVINGGYITIDADLIMCDNTRMFLSDNTGATGAKLTSLIVNASTISCSTTLINSNNACHVNIKSQYIVSYSTSNLSAITSTGIIAPPPPVTALTAGLYITSGVMILAGIGIDALSKVNIIDIIAGSLYFNVDTFGVEGSFYNAIHIGNGLNVNFLNIRVAGIIAANSRFLLAEGAVECNIGIIAGGLLDGGSGMVLVEAGGLGNNGGVTGKINSIIALGDGVGLLTSGSGRFNGEIGTIQFIGGVDTGTAIQMTDGSEINGTIMNIGSNSGPAISSSSTGNMFLTFQRIFCNAGSVALNFTGTGDARLIGIEISTQNTDRVLYVTNQAQVSLICENIYVNSCEAVVYTESLGPNQSGSAYIDFQQISVNNATAAVFYASNDRVQARGLSVYCGKAPTLIHCLDNTNFIITAQTLGGNDLDYISKIETNAVATINVLEINANNIIIDGFNMDSANQLRVTSDSLYIGATGPTGINSMVTATNNGNLYFDVKNVQLNVPAFVNVMDINTGSGAYINFDRVNVGSGTNFLSCVSTSDVRVTGKEIQTSILSGSFINANLTNLALDLQKINVNNSFAILTATNNATVDLQYLNLSTSLLNGGAGFNINGTRLVNVNGQSTDLNTVVGPTGIEPGIRIANTAGNSQEFYGEFNRFSLNGGLMPGVIVTDGGNANLHFGYLYSQGSCLHTESTGTVTLVATQAITNSIDPCVTIFTPDGANTPVTVGGYLSSTPAVHTIEWLLGSYQTPLRVLPSTLLCDGSAESIYCDISINPNATVSPTIATTAASANVNVIPTGTIFVDSNIF